MKKLILISMAMLAFIALMAGFTCNPTISKEDKELVERFLTPEEQEAAAKLQKEVEQRLKEGTNPYTQAPKFQTIPPPKETEETLPSKVDISNINTSPLPDGWVFTVKTLPTQEAYHPGISDCRWVAYVNVEYRKRIEIRSGLPYKFCVEFNQGDGKLTGLGGLYPSQTGRLIKMSDEIRFSETPYTWEIVYPIEATDAKFWIEVD